LVFGGITIVCGIVGTLAGGFVLDFMTTTVSNAFKVGIQIIIRFEVFYKRDFPCNIE
jgi:hypothetical protein